ncbi:hypothetical protein [Endozoicomonas ascidiicola]|uniref:hypothetical protein n=1 Tax=Endozoicomonas ascidiicola TaxID=1698521 RepID=UPI00082CECF8|nr:hypothetical protein [Endozoicomonas ascidiicola]
MSELTKVRKSVMDPTQVIPDMAGQDGKVLSNNGNLPRWIWGRIVGELARFSFDTPPAGFFALDGSRIVNGKNDFSALANSGSRFITISGNDLILADAVDFGRGKGSSGRSVGSFEGDAIRNFTGTVAIHTGEKATGAFTVVSRGSYSGYGNLKSALLSLDISRIVPTAPENRPKSLTELVCIYHGVL